MQVCSDVLGVLGRLYISRLRIESYDGEHTIMDRNQQAAANEKVEASGEPIEWLDHPLVIKVDETQVPIFAFDAVLMGILGLSKLYSSRFG